MADYKKYEPIFGAWYIKRKIGAGSFGEVFEIERQEFGRTYRSALKIISIPSNEDEVKSMMADGTDMDSIASYYKGVVKDITDENAIMSELKGNSNIVSYEDHQIIPHEDGIGYDILIRMELLTSLIDHMIHNEMTERDVLKLGIDLCHALTLCEQKKILHRDIKPGNIFISDTGDYKLGDFGIARTIEKTTSEMSRKGTYTYMAPEVYKGEKYGIRADLYSLGIVMYYLLNYKRTPFLPLPPQQVTHDAKISSMQRRMSGEPLPPPKEASPILAGVILKACAYDPRNRFATPEAFRRALIAVGNGEQVPLDSIPGQNVRRIEQREPMNAAKAGSAMGAYQNAGSRNGQPGYERGYGTGSSGGYPGSTGGYPGQPYGDPNEQTVLDVGQFSGDYYSGSSGTGGSTGGYAGTGGSTGGYAGAGGYGNAGRPGAPGRPTRSKKSINGSRIAMIVAAVLVIIIGGFIGMHLVGGGGSDPVVSTELQPDDIKILGSDINFSQLNENKRQMTLERDGVDVLIKVQNNGDVPLRAFKFRMKQEGDSEYLEDVKGKELFEAYGYIPNGQRRYMYAHIYLPNTTDKKKQAKKRIYPDSITAEGDLGAYDMPEGEIKQFHKNSDSYDVGIFNTNPEIKINNTATIVALRKDIDDHSKLDNLWGAGTVGQDINGNDKKVVKGAIYNPDFVDPYDYDRYEVYVFDYEYLANPDFPDREKDKEE